MTEDTNTGGSKSVRKAHQSTRPATAGTSRSTIAEVPTSAERARRALRQRSLFEAVKEGPGETVPLRALTATLERAGLRGDDPRLTETLDGVRALEWAGRHEIDFDTFSELVRPNALIVERALQGRLVVPDFDALRTQLERVFEVAKSDSRGSVADYIPQLGRVDPEQFAAAVVTIDGQRVGLGESTADFCVQSICKPISYCLALEEHGESVVHRHIGCEPSGHSFNELALNRNGRPHNPMINAGAIMSGALIRPESTMADRFDHVMATWSEMAGGVKPGFSNATYLSERRTADRNFALGYFMREKQAFPPGTDLVATLEFYFQCCSIEMTAESMSMVAATLANGGVCPTTGTRVLKPSTVRACLSMMYSCGMYDFSGEWAFTIGLPAKSGVSGALMVVVPNVMGLCVWSPRLDDLGNTVRGITFCRELVETFNFHNYDSLAVTPDKIDPRRRVGEAVRDAVGDLCWAASEGDLGGLRRIAAQGVELGRGDYDGRTPLHLAASEGHLHVVEFLADQGASIDTRDRWGNTPLDDAERERHDEVAAFLSQRMGR